MILIGDGGSTKTDWAILDDSGQVVGEFAGAGFNPYIYNKEYATGFPAPELNGYVDRITSVRYFGAGCTPAKRSFVKELLQQTFPVARIEVDSDLMAAVLSLGRGGECIVAILGTGSNSCYYDGKNIGEQVPSLGFILGDEGSGAALGRKLLGEVLKNRLPEAIAKDFFETYGPDRDWIMEEIYRGAAPNRFMAGFVPFLKKHIGDESIGRIVRGAFAEFVERNLLAYTKIETLPVHFTGGVARYFGEELRLVLTQYHLSPGEISPCPMPGLLEYYKTKNDHD